MAFCNNNHSHYSWTHKLQSTLKVAKRDNYEVLYKRVAETLYIYHEFNTKCTLNGDNINLI